MPRKSFPAVVLPQLPEVLDRTDRVDLLRIRRKLYVRFEEDADKFYESFKEIALGHGVARDVNGEPIRGIDGSLIPVNISMPRQRLMEKWADKFLAEERGNLFDVGREDKDGPPRGGPINVLIKNVNRGPAARTARKVG